MGESGWGRDEVVGIGEGEIGEFEVMILHRGIDMSG